MRVKGLLIIFLMLAELLCAQSSNTRYWVAFTDKNNTPYSISNPQQFLSARAISRRALHGFPVTTQDLPVDPAYISQVTATGAVLVSRSRWMNGIIVRITNPSQISSINALSFVASTKSVALIKPMPLYEGPREQAAVASKQLASQSADRFDYGQGYGQINQLNGICLHNQFYDGTGMEIAELDNGYQNANTLAVFDSLYMQNRVLGIHNFFKGDGTEIYTLGGHGTSVLSCMAANAPGSFVGTAPYAKYYLLRTEVDTCEQIIEEYSWVSAIEYADSAGADIATCSLGYIGFDDATQNHTWADLDGKTSVASRSATLAARRGMIVCVAAGNAGSSSWRKITIPSDADSILCVGAVDNGGNYAGFSSQGYSADGRVKPEVVAQGLGTTVVSTSGNVITSNGTSFSTPVLAGLVACLWQANPTKKNMEIIQAIKASASQYATPDSLLGYGIPDFCLADQILKSTGVVGEQEQIDFGGTGLTVDGFDNCTMRAELYDVNGRLLSATVADLKYGQQTTLSLPAYSQAPAGIYLLKVNTDTGYSASRKIVKQ